MPSDDSLQSYRSKRDFSATHEPRGEAATGATAWRFVIQKHQARSLHYDLRLELDGVLKSWAVPKGPSLDTRQKRLAVRTEDHPLEYLDFEGVIPAGQYGAGAMLVWDLGVWECQTSDARQALETGELKFRLDGHKLSGKWMLLWTGKRSRDAKRANQWLLIKEKDASTRPESDGDILQQLPASVLSGRTLEEVFQQESAHQKRHGSQPSQRSARSNTSPKRRAKHPASPDGPAAKLEPQTLTRARRAEFPERVAPSLPTATTRPPEGEQWLHEIKFDGYRMLCTLQPRRVRFLSRNGNDWTDKFTVLASAIRRLPTRDAILDGEVAIVGESGATDFQALQNAIHSPRSAHRLRYFAFDLLRLDGHDLRATPLVQRRNALQKLIERARAASNDSGFPLQFSESITGDGPLVLKQACLLGVEGIVSKRKDSRYVEGRVDHWLKAKCLRRREFVVGGYTKSEADRTGFGALVLGLPGQDGLFYRGRVGTGFSERTLESLAATMKTLRQDACPFERTDLLLQKERGTVWLAPTLVVEVEFGGWTGDGLVRFASFRGVREDMTAADVVSHSEEEVAGEAPRPLAQPPLSRSTRRPPELRLTNPQRVVYPKSGVTKLGVASYYARVAAWMTPHLAGRPLTIVRCPQGASKQAFFQKHPPKGLPDSVTKRRVEIDGESHWFMEANCDAALLALAQWNTLEFHAGCSRLDRLDRPDRVALDLDPHQDVAWRRVADAAEQIRELLALAGLRSFVKTTGGKGLHVVAPVNRRHSWSETKGLAECVAMMLCAKWPARYTMSSSKAARRGKIFLDCNRNVQGATFVAPYSTRAREDAGVSTPLAWDELPAIGSPLAYTLANIDRRLESLTSDPWAELAEVKQSITRAGLQRLAQYNAQQ